MDVTLPVLPELAWVPSPNFYEGRGSEEIVRIVDHRWASPTGTVPQEHAHYEGVIEFFQERSSQVSSHIVMPGFAAPGTATQMVAFADSAWTEMAYNRSSISIECADNIWLGKDPVGLAVLARMNAKLLQAHGLPAVYSIEKGFCRHADLGVAGGGHTQCPTTDMAVWRAFVLMVQAEYKRGGFLPVWGR